jgi:hypothetical protein
MIACYRDVVLSLMLLAQVVLHSALFAPFAQTPSQDAAPTMPASKVLRSSEKQEHLCCYEMHFVKPIFPKKARLAHIEGVVKLHLVFADDGSIVELQPVSGDPLLVASAIEAVQQWRVFFSRVAGRPEEHEVALALTFSIVTRPGQPISILPMAMLFGPIASVNSRIESSTRSAAIPIVSPLAQSQTSILAPVSAIFL